MSFSIAMKRFETIFIAFALGNVYRQCVTEYLFYYRGTSTVIEYTARTHNW